MNTVKVRDIEIGAGAPKIIVPIVGVTKNDIIEEAKTFHSIPVDVVEWRVDWFEGVFDFAPRSTRQYSASDDVPYLQRGRRESYRAGSIR